MTASKLDETYRTLNPATGEVVRTFDTADDAQADAALARAHAAYLSWRETPIAEKVALFERMDALLRGSTDELARLMSLEMGKPVAESAAEIQTAAHMFGYYAEFGPELLVDEHVTVPGFGEAIVTREPMGVVLAIEPWNGPVYQAMRPTAPNLMLGNTVLLKPSELSAGSTTFLDGLFAKAGFPPDVYQTVLLSKEQVSRYIADDRVRAVSFTGSDRSGAIIAEQAARAIKPIVLELGGSDAFIALESADVAKAAETAALTRLVISGQVCASPKRIIVLESIADEFIANFNAVLAKQTLGDQFDPATTFGPLSSVRAAELLQEQLDDAVAHGATVLVAGGRVDRPGAYFEPAVITDITPEMRVYHEEAFGPLAMIYRVADVDAAIELANDSPYGLSGTVFGEVEEARAVARRLDTGSVGINNFMGAPVEIPFGGTKRSGLGRELGRSGMDQFANIKTYGISSSS